MTTGRWRTPATGRAAEAALEGRLTVGHIVDMALEASDRAPRTEWCWFCRRAVRTDDDESRIVTLPDGSGGVLCGPCIDKADVGPDVPLDMTEDDGREGDPAFNGAFDRW